MCLLARVCVMGGKQSIGCTNVERQVGVGDDFCETWYSCSVGRSQEMKYEAISLLSLLLVGSWATDIFDGMEDETNDPEDAVGTTVKDVPTTVKDDPTTVKDVPKTCVNDIVPQDTISLKSEALQSIQNLPNEVPQAPPVPDLKLLWTQLSTIFQQPTFSDKIDEAKQVFKEYQALIQVFSGEWLKFFTRKRQDAISNIQKVVQQTNKEITDFFSRHLSEFDGMCLPEDNECLQSVQNSLEEYSKKVQENTAACEEFADRQLKQHDQVVEDEQKKLNSGMLQIDGCFQKKQFFGGVMACLGSVAANAFKKTSQANEKFSSQMSKASASLTNRLGRFRNCVVERKRLLAGGQQQIAERAKGCLRAQKSDGGGGGGLFE